MQQPTTCIIGAGISGLTAAKSLADYGIPFDVFESSDRVGGNWAFGNPNGHSSAYRSLHIDTSKQLMEFADFPVPEAFPDFPHHTEIKAYLDSYADSFGLRERIAFQNGVEHARRREGGGWDVRTEDGQERAYDALIVANGHHWCPRYPDFPGEFTGESFHSHHYVSPTEPLDLRGRKILVVGIGNSAADIVSELSQRAWGNEVVLSTRSGAWVVPKYVFGTPSDRLARTLPGVPLSWQRRLLRPLPRLLSGAPERYGLPRPNHAFLEAHPTQSSELLLRLGSGDARARTNVSRLDGRTVHFDDGPPEEFDVIVYATGYSIRFPFLDAETLSAPGNRLPLYKRMFDPRYDDLLLIGFAQALPTLFPFVECQSRLAARYLRGLYRPPDPDEMRRVIAADEARFVGHYRDSARHTQQVDFFVYERETRTREIPQGRERVRRQGPVAIAGRTQDPASSRPSPAPNGATDGR